MFFKYTHNLVSSDARTARFARLVVLPVLALSLLLLWSHAAIADDLLSSTGKQWLGTRDDAARTAVVAQNPSDLYAALAGSFTDHKLFVADTKFGEKLAAHVVGDKADCPAEVLYLTVLASIMTDKCNLGYAISDAIGRPIFASAQSGMKSVWYSRATAASTSTPDNALLTLCCADAQYRAGSFLKGDEILSNAAHSFSPLFASVAADIRAQAALCASGASGKGQAPGRKSDLAYNEGRVRYGKLLEQACNSSGTAAHALADTQASFALWLAWTNKHSKSEDPNVATQANTVARRVLKDMDPDNARALATLAILNPKDANVLARIAQLGTSTEQGFQMNLQAGFDGFQASMDLAGVNVVRLIGEPVSSIGYPGRASTVIEVQQFGN